MGTVSIDNSSVEAKLDTVSTKVEANTSAMTTLVSGVNNLIARMGSVIKELRIANVHNEVVTGEKITKQDIQSNG